MPLLTLRNVILGFGGPNLLDQVNLQIEAGERLCLLGRNGEGKSTLMKLIAAQIDADQGQIERQQGLKVAYLTQDVPAELDGSVYDVVASGLDETGELLRRYHQVSLQLAQQADERTLAELERIQHQLESRGGWQMSQQIESTLSRLQLPADQAFSALSGGLKRRVLLARALVIQPDLLLLDEPTNHLDIDAIQWLEEFMLSWNGSLMFITHDRAFLRRLATRIIELDRGQLTSWPGDYDNFLQRKQEMLDAEAKLNAEFDKKLAQEESWIRQGIKARRTRNEGRVRALKAMREQRQQRREQKGQATLAMNELERSGKIVIEAEQVSYAYDDTPIVRDFSTTILRGDKVGIIGPNGVGKSTLIQLLLGQLQPQQGHIKLGTKLDLAYFDQHRSDLEDDKTLRDNLAEGRERIDINGSSKHVIGYLGEFLFTPQQCNAPVSTLSGGERNRLMLAKLFSKPFNLLVMDEPTNDLDIETLELLEALLVDYQGTLLLVSHDRDFLDNVVTSTLVFEGQGKVNEYVGGYDDWLRQAQHQSSKQATPVADRKGPAKAAQRKPAKLSYKDQRELDQLPARIEQLEAELEQIHQTMASAAFYKQDNQQITATQDRLQQIEDELAEAYERWETLDKLQADING